MGVDEVLRYVHREGDEAAELGGKLGAREKCRKKKGHRELSDAVSEDQKQERERCRKTTEQSGVERYRSYKHGGDEA